MKVTDQQIILTYTGVMHELTNYTKARWRATLAKRIYQVFVNHGLANGWIIGKNPSERENAACEAYPVLWAHMISSDDHAMVHKLNLDLANLELEEMRALLRLAELEASIGEEDTKA